MHKLNLLEKYHLEPQGQLRKQETSGVAGPWIARLVASSKADVTLAGFFIELKHVFCKNLRKAESSQRSCPCPGSPDFHVT